MHRSFWLRCTYGQPASPGDLIPKRISIVFELEGDASSPVHGECFPAGSGELSSPDLLGHCNHDCIHQQAGSSPPLQKWGIPEMDLFAPQENCKVKKFFNLDPWDEGMGIDNLANPWAFSLLYAFPPVRPIAASLQKFLSKKTCLILAKKAMVLYVAKPACSVPLILLTEMEDLISQGLVFHPQVTTLKWSTWLQVEDQPLKSQGFPVKVMKTLVNCRKLGTRAIYSKVRQKV